MVPSPSQERFEILVVDDSDVDADLARLAIRGLTTPCRSHLVADGDDALEFMRRTGQYRDAPRPHLVLLDINMPRVGGFEVLRELKADSDLTLIPVIMLTSSSDAREISKAYREHANGYVVKPVTFDEFEEVLERIAAYWFKTSARSEHTDP